MDTLLSAYAAIGDLTPLERDCGELCGAACCQQDADGQGGVHLFPGEEELLRDIDWGSIEPRLPGALAPILQCGFACDRDRRPLGCRIFPLTPVIGKDGAWTVRMDVRARPMCPLCMSGVRGLNRDFVLAVRNAIRIIAETAEGDAFLRRWAALEDAFRKELW